MPHEKVLPFPLKSAPADFVQWHTLPPAPRKEPPRGHTPDSVVTIGAATNIVLAALKLAAGTLSGSASLIADAGHSLSDLFSDAFCWLAPRLRHARAEAACTLGISAILCATGLGMSSAALKTLVQGAARTAPPIALPGSEAAALLIALLSVLSKEWLFRITHAVGKRYASPALVANAFHHRSDALSSIAAIVGVGGALLGFGCIDLLGALAVGGMVLHMGIQVGSEALPELLRPVRTSAASADSLAAAGHGPFLARHGARAFAIHEFPSGELGVPARLLYAL